MSTTTKQLFTVYVLEPKNGRKHRQYLRFAVVARTTAEAAAKVEAAEHTDVTGYTVHRVVVEPMCVTACGHNTVPAGFAD